MYTGRTARHSREFSAFARTETRIRFLLEGEGREEDDAAAIVTKERAMIGKTINLLGLLILLLLTCASCETPKTAARDAATSGNADALLGRWVRSSGNCDRPELTFTPSTAAIYVGVQDVPTTFDYSPITYAADGSNVTVRFYRPHPYVQSPEKESLTFHLQSRDEIVMKLPGADLRFRRCVDSKE